MTDESKLREQQDRGQRASVVLKELDEAFEALEEDCFQTFRSSDMHDDAGRRAARYYLRVMDDVLERFKAAVINGEAARKELIRLRDPNKWSQIIGSRATR